MKKRVAEKIRLLRLQKGLSQQNMADELNLTVAAYSNIERGVSEVNLSRLSAIAELLDTTPIEILTDEILVSDVDVKLGYQSNVNQQLLLIMQQQQLFQHQLDNLQRDVFQLKESR